LPTLWSVAASSKNKNKSQGSALNCRPTVSERITGNHRHGVQRKFKVASQKVQGMTGVLVIAETLLVIPRVSAKSRSGM
jgi:hypothetical protein